MSDSESVERPTAATRLAQGIKQLRLDRGMSQRTLASAIGYSRQYVSMVEWEDATVPSQGLIAAIDDALGAHGALNSLWADAKADQKTVRSRDERAQRGSPPDHHSCSSTPSATHSDRPRAANEGPNPNVIDVLQRVHKLGRGIDPLVMREVHTTTDLIISDYRNLNPAEMSRVLVRQRRWIEELLGASVRPDQSRWLLRLGAKTSGILGYITVGYGQFQFSRAYLLEAFTLAELSEHANIRAWVRSLQSFCEYYSGNYPQALAHALDGLNGSPSAPLKARLAANCEARALGMLGDSRGVDFAIEAAYGHLSNANPAIPTPSSIALDAFDESQIAGNAATAYASLGSAVRVEEHAENALSQIDPTSSLGRSLVLIDLARSQALAGHGDLERACILVEQALALSSGRRIVSLQERFALFMSEATEQWGTELRLDSLRESAIGMGRSS